MRRWEGGQRRLRFMEGRYGADALGRFLSVGACAVLLLSLLAGRRGASLSRGAALLALGMIGWSYYRILSRDFARRSEENRRFLALTGRAGAWLAVRRSCFRQRKDYAFFRCPSCRRMARVPRGRGRIRITCPHCGYAYERRT